MIRSQPSTLKINRMHDLSMDLYCISPPILSMILEGSEKKELLLCGKRDRGPKKIMVPRKGEEEKERKRFVCREIRGGVQRLTSEERLSRGIWQLLRCLFFPASTPISSPQFHWKLKSLSPPPSKLALRELEDGRWKT